MIKKTFAIVMCLAMFAPMFAGAQTYDINMLLQVIQQLQAQLAALQDNTTSSVSFETNLYYGMSSNEVQTLQETLGVEPTSGWFGPITLAAVKEFQSENGVPNTGYVGPLTRTALNNMYSVPSEPLPYYPMPTWPTAPVTTEPAYTGQEGTITTSDTGIATETTLRKYDSDKAVLAFETTAKNSPVTIKRVDVNITATDQLPWRTFESLDLYVDGQLVDSMDVNSSNLIETKYYEEYKARFSGLNIVNNVDEVKQLVLKVNLDYPTSTASTTFTLPERGVRGIDAAGLDQYSDATVTSDAIDIFTTGNSAQVKVLNNSQNVDKVVSFSENNTTYDVPALYFDLKNDGTEPANIRTIVITGSKASATSDISAVKLYDGATLLSSEAYTSGTTITFNNLDFNLNANTQKTFTVKLDLAKNTTTGVITLGKFSVASTSDVTAINASSDDKIDVDGTATGSTLKAARITPELSFVSSSIAMTPDTASKQADATIKFNVTAKGGDIYFDKNATSFDVKRDDDTGLVAYGTDFVVSTDADTADTADHVIREGETKLITITSKVSDESAGFHFINLAGFAYETTDATADETPKYETNLTDIKTDSIYLAADAE